MLVKLIRPLLESGWSSMKLVSSQSLSTSTIYFQQSFSGTNTGGSAKPTEKSSNSKNQQQSGNKNKNRAVSDVEQGKSQQEGPADKEAERKSSNNNDQSKKSRK